MTLNKLAIALLTTCVLIGNSLAVVNDSAVKVKWSYKGALGPAYWADLDPAFRQCAIGKFQSPINLKVKKLLPLSSPSFKINYRPSPLNEIDNGVTIVKMGEHDIAVTSGHGVQLNVPTDWQKKQTLMLDDVSYRLLQMHFHSPSEHQLDNEAASVEIHFLNQGPDGKLAVIAVFVKVGKANPVLAEIVKNIPAVEGKEVALSELVDINQLLPSVRQAYRFEGSLTTPPCTEGVQWLVMAAPITASSEQIVKLRQASNGGNARSVQPFNKRNIVFTVEKVK